MIITILCKRRYYINISTSNIVSTKIGEYVYSKAQDGVVDHLSKVVEEATNKVAGKTVPIMFDFIMLNSEIQEEKEKRKSEINYFSDITSLANQSFINDKMDLYAVAILNDYDNVCSFYTQTGVNTEE